MTRASTLLVMATALLVAGNAVAVKSMSPSAMHKRQLVGCMARQMSASKTISYNEAAKLCKDQLKSRNDSWAANEAAKPAGGGRQSRNSDHQ